MKKTEKSFDELTHFWGRIWIWSAVVVVLFVPLAACLYYQAWPQASAVFKGLLGVLCVGFQFQSHTRA